MVPTLFLRQGDAPPDACLKDTSNCTVSVHQDRLQLAIHWTNNGMIILHGTGNQFVDHESKIHPIIHNSCAVFSFSGYKTQQLIDRLGWYTQDHRFWFGTNIRISQQKLFSHRCHEVMLSMFFSSLF